MEMITHRVTVLYYIQVIAYLLIYSEDGLTSSEVVLLTSVILAWLTVSNLGVRYIF